MGPIMHPITRRISDRVARAYADRVWSDEKRKYRKRSAAGVALDMALERIALVNYTLAVALIVYVAFIYLQEVPNVQSLRAVTMEGVHMLEKERGRVKGILDADRVVRDETNERLHFFKVKYTTFPEKDVTHVIRADRGMQYTNTKDLFFEGDVFVRSEHPVMENGREAVPRRFTVDRFYTQKLDYAAGAKILATETPVKLVRAEMVVEGDRMRSLTKEKRTEVNGNVRITVYDEETSL